MAGLLVAAAIIAAASIAPLFTAHPLAGHLLGRTRHGLGGVEQHPAMVLVLAFALAGTMPPLGFLRATRGLRRAHSSVARVRDESLPAKRFGIRYRRLRSETILVFTAGLLRPEIFVSTGAERQLNSKALEAALLHERSHQIRGDVALGTLLHIVERGLGWLPGVHHCTGWAKLRSEVRADRWAIRRGADQLALFDAIVAAGEAPQTAAPLGGVDALPRLELLAGRRTGQPALPWHAPAAVVVWILAPPLIAHSLVWIGIACGAHLS